MAKKENFDPTWIAPNTPTAVANFIQSARIIMFKMKDGEGMKRAITSGNSLVQGASAFVALVINLVESKMGEQSPQNEAIIATHLAGTIVDYAAEEGDSEANDKKAVVEDVLEAVMKVLQSPEQEQAEQESPMDQMQEPQEAPQGPPQAPPPQPLMGASGV